MIIDVVAQVPKALQEAVASKTYANGQVVLREGEPGDRVCFLVKGKCKIYTSGANGQLLLQNIVSAPEVFGMIEQFKRRNNVCTVEAYGDVTVLMVPTDAFLKWLTLDNNFAIAMLERVSDIAYMQIGRQSQTIMYPLKQRLMRFLQDKLEDQENPENGLVIDKQILAQELGTSVRHLNRTIAGCEAAGLIKNQGGRLVLLDKN